jgi:hypothetical protein
MTVGRAPTTEQGPGEQSSTAPRGRLLVALFVQGLVFASNGTAVAVFLGGRFGVARTGLVIGVGGLLGRLLGPRLERASFFRSTSRRAAVATMSTVIFLLVAFAAPWWLSVPSMALALALGGLVTSVVMHAAGDRLPRGSAASMSGQALGLWVGGAATAFSDTATLAVCVTLTLVGLGVPAIAGLSSTVASDEESATRSRYGVAVFLLATLSYGPLAVFSVLVAEEFGAGWIGPAFLLYAAGSWVAAALPRLTPRTNRSAALLAALGCAVWVTGLHSVAFVLVARFLSGVLMFLAQGSMLTRASRDGGREGLAAALAGVGIGSQAAALWAGFLSDISVGLMSAAGALATLVLALLFGLSRGPVAHRDAG